MYPIVYEVPGIGFPIRSFGLMVAAGFILSAWVFNRLIQRNARDPARELPRYAQIPVWVVIGVILGARFMYVVVEVLRGTPTGQSYLDEPWRVLAIWEGGLVMYGGLFGGLVAGTWGTRHYHLPTRRAMDFGVCAGFFGLSVGRIGCYLVGDDYGRVVPEHLRSLPFPIVLRVPEPLPEHSLFGSENAGEVLYATQIWMSANALLLGLIGLWLLKRRRYGGQATLVLLLAYAVTRSFIEYFRGDHIRGTWFSGVLSTSQIVSIAVGFAALALLIKNRSRREPLEL